MMKPLPYLRACASLVAALSISACGTTECIDFDCARRTEVMLTTSFQAAGSYRVTGTPRPTGVEIDCSFDLDSAGRATGLSGCDGAGFLPGGDITGLTLPGHLESLDLRIELDGAVLYEGVAVLDHVDEVRPECGNDNCNVNVLLAD